MKGLSIFFFVLAGVFAFAVGSIVLAIFLPAFLYFLAGAREDVVAWGITPYPDWTVLLVTAGVVMGLVLLVLVLSLVALRSVKGKTSRAEARVDMEQTRIVQEIYQGLSQMERRIESLETLLLDRNRNAEPLYKD